MIQKMSADGGSFQVSTRRRERARTRGPRTHARWHRAAARPQAFVDDFADRTRQLKSIVLLHSAQPDEGTHEVPAQRPAAQPGSDRARACPRNSALGGPRARGRGAPRRARRCALTAALLRSRWTRSRPSSPRRSAA